MSHSARWLLMAICLLAPTAARAAEPGLDLTQDDLRKKFREITTEFTEVERAKRSSAFHITQLEANVRELGTKIDLLDARLKTFEMAIESVREEFAKMAKAKTEEAKATPGAKVGTPAGPTAPAATQEVIARIEDDQHTIEGTFLTFTGTVANLTTRPLMFVQVRLMLLDEHGTLVKAESAYTSPQVIPPLGKARYRIVTRRDERIRSSNVSVRAE